MELYERSFIWGITDHFWLKNAFATTKNVNSSPYFYPMMMQKPKKIVVRLAEIGGRTNTVHWHSVRPEFETLSSPHQAAPYMPEWFSWGLLFFIFSIIFNTFIKKGKNEYIFKENPKKKVGALLKICNLRYYRSFLTEKQQSYNKKCNTLSFFLSLKLTCFQLKKPKKMEISSKKNQ